MQTFFCLSAEIVLLVTLSGSLVTLTDLKSSPMISWITGGFAVAGVVEGTGTGAV